MTAWVWDTLAPGQLTSTTTYTGGASGSAYVQKVIGYTTTGHSKGTETIIPSGPLAGTYITEDYYAPGGELDQYVASTAGGLPAETVTTGYDTAGDPDSVGSDQGGSTPYVAALSYTELGQPHEYEFGTNAEPAYLTDTWNPLGQLQEATTAAGVSPVTVDDQNYAYDSAGDILKNADTPASGPADVQCFSYDYGSRPTAAWSQGNPACTGGPSQAAEAGAAAPYWDAYGYDGSSNLGENNLTQVTATPSTGQAVTTSLAYPPGAGAAQPHAPVTSTQSGAQTSYAYNN